MSFHALVHQSGRLILSIHQLNIAAFIRDRSIPMGAKPLPEGHSWVSPRSKAEMLAEYEDWGPDVQTYLGFLESPSVWFIHIVDPPLETFCRGRAAVLGDAVSIVNSLSLVLICIDVIDIEGTRYVTTSWCGRWSRNRGRFDAREVVRTSSSEEIKC